ncbi:MAG: signal recognition particle-docking protein FtsY [Oscillospiraceae bacterium]|jgi:fused signal recognition particle receptor|nr:signal recognition particle-docking protein FtsY [Oscillospiraceae bacterium]
MSEKYKRNGVVRMGFFEKLKAGLKKTRDAMVSGIDRVFGWKQVDESFFEQLEETLIVGDVGVNVAIEICERLRKISRKLAIDSPEELKVEFTKIVVEMLEPANRFVEEIEEKETVNPEAFPKKIILVVGVNGVGKTTTVGKLAFRLQNEGNEVAVVAADTFRDAAVEQLEALTKSLNIKLFKSETAKDPGAVIFEAIKKAAAQKVEVLICDTAGRLHNKNNLMMELQKIGKIIERNCLSAHKETFWVMDVTTGQNAIFQAREFKNAVKMTGIILTKLDGTSKGGVVINIAAECGVPVKYAGLGEKIEDLVEFEAQKFAQALFGI